MFTDLSKEHSRVHSFDVRCTGRAVIITTLRCTNTPDRSHFVIFSLTVGNIAIIVIVTVLRMKLAQKRARFVWLFVYPRCYIMLHSAACEINERRKICVRVEFYWNIREKKKIM